MDPLTRIPVFGYILPAIVGALIAIVLLRPRRSDAAAGPGASVLAAVVMIAGVAIMSLLGQYGIGGPITIASWAQGDFRIRALAVVVPVFGLFLLAAFIRGGDRSSVILGTLGGGVIAVIAALLVGSPHLGLDGRLPILDRFLVLAAAGLGGGLASGALALLAKRGHSFASAAILGGLALATGAAILGSGSSKVGQFALSLGVGLLPCVLAMVIGARRGTALSAAAMATVVGILAGFLTSGRLYAETDAWLALGLAAVPLVGLIAGVCIAALTGPRSRLISIAQIAAAAITAGALVAPGMLTLRKIESGSRHPDDRRLFNSRHADVLAHPSPASPAAPSPQGRES